MSQTHLSEQELIRREKLVKLQEAGVDPYPAPLYPVSHFSTDIKDHYTEETKEQFAVEPQSGAFAIDFQIQRTGYDGPIELGFAAPISGLKLLNPRIDAKAKEGTIYVFADGRFCADTMAGKTRKRITRTSLDAAKIEALTGLSSDNQSYVASGAMRSKTPICRNLA